MPKMPGTLDAEPLIDLTHAARLLGRDLGFPVDRKVLPALVTSHSIAGRPHGKGFRLTLGGYWRLYEIIRKARKSADGNGHAADGNGTARRKTRRRNRHINR